MNNSEEYETFVKVLAKDNVSKVFMNNDGENMITVITEMLNHSTSSFVSTNSCEYGSVIKFPVLS